jgi:hypothetical protein
VEMEGLEGVGDFIHRMKIRRFNHRVLDKLNEEISAQTEILRIKSSSE